MRDFAMLVIGFGFGTVFSQMFFLFVVLPRIRSMLEEFALEYESGHSNIATSGHGSGHYNPPD